MVACPLAVGGLDYQGGWRLPGEEARPQGTVAYQSRALQTPFRCTPRTPPPGLLPCCSLHCTCRRGAFLSCSYWGMLPSSYWEISCTSGVINRHHAYVRRRPDESGAAPVKPHAQLPAPLCGNGIGANSVRYYLEGCRSAAAASAELGCAMVRREAGGSRELEVVLNGAERSDSLVFVVKEGSTWYDKRGDNFEARPSPFPTPPSSSLSLVCCPHAASSPALEAPCVPALSRPGSYAEVPANDTAARGACAAGWLLCRALLCVPPRHLATKLPLTLHRCNCEDVYLD